MAGIPIKAVIPDNMVPSPGIVRIPVTVPEGNRQHGTGYCVNITELSYEWGGPASTASYWMGQPFLAIKH
ncbi:MAG: hypothetical protein LLG16_01280 [Euryarchaeota archaeon]|nr:hypothetical protein [Euryarchaeota archaeon]